MIRKTKKRGYLTVLLCVLAASILLISLGGVLYLRPYAGSKMDMTLMDIPTVHEPSVLYAYDPSTRMDRTGILHPAPDSTLTDARPRIYVPYSEMPADLINAFISRSAHPVSSRTTSGYCSKQLRRTPFTELPGM